MKLHQVVVKFFKGYSSIIVDSLLPKVVKISFCSLSRFLVLCTFHETYFEQIFNAVMQIKIDEQIYHLFCTKGQDGKNMLVNLTEF